MTQPTDQDLRNAATRQIIAERQNREHDTCLALAEQCFGPGWLPSGRHFLLDKEEEDRCRRTGERPVAAATVYSARNEEGEKRHFILADGKPVEVASYQEGFGPMLLEPHPTMRIEIRGQMVAPHRYSLCWAGFERYEPRSAEQLAAQRQTRERKREEKAERKFQEATPLWALIERAEQEERGR